VILDCGMQNADSGRIQGGLSQSTFRNLKAAIETGNTMRSRFFIMVITLGVLSVIAVGDMAAGQSRAARKRPRGSICGNPEVSCKTSATFQPNDLPFRVPANSVIWDTELFYAVMLKSVTVGDYDCDVFVPEIERLRTQALFPDHKVFTSRCADPENLFYTNVGETHRIMAVYAGNTLAEARRVLDSVKATGKFPGANLRRMRTGFNGT